MQPSKSDDEVGEHPGLSLFRSKKPSVKPEMKIKAEEDKGVNKYIKTSSTTKKTPKSKHPVFTTTWAVPISDEPYQLSPAHQKALEKLKQEQQAEMQHAKTPPTFFYEKYIWDGTTVKPMPVEEDTPIVPLPIIKSEDL
jgi:hypothetical protein